ncbi:hypothetical protein ABPG72_020710 [Tetrahymena utriculariae]
MIIQKQYEYVCKTEKKMRKQNSYERIVNSKFLIPKSESKQQDAQYDTVNFQAQIYYNQADKLSKVIPICDPQTNPLNDMYLMPSNQSQVQNNSFIKAQNDVKSIKELDEIYISLQNEQVVLLDSENEKQQAFQPFLSSKWNRDSNYQSPLKYPQKALISKSNKVLEIENSNDARKYLTNLKRQLIHRLKNLDSERDFQTRFESVDNQLYKQRQSKYNPGLNESFKVEQALRAEIPEKQLGPQFQLRFNKREICDQSKISLIDDQTREQLKEEIFMREELTNFIKDRQVNSNRKKWNLQYKLQPITHPLKPFELRRKHKYTNPIQDQTSFLINEIYYDKEFEAQINPLLSNDKQKVLGQTFSHRFNNSPLVKYRQGRSMSRDYPYNRGIFEITQCNKQNNSLNQSFL